MEAIRQSEHCSVHCERAREESCVVSSCCLPRSEAGDLTDRSTEHACTEKEPKENITSDSLIHCINYSAVEFRLAE
jgi:hypothetical protein